MGLFGFHSPVELVHWVANIERIATGNFIFSSRDAAAQQARDRENQEDRAARTWDDARKVTNTGYDSLRSQHGAGYDPPVVVGDKLEAFSSWPHQRIWDALNDSSNPITATWINEAAGTWRKMATDTDSARNDFANKVNGSVQQKMTGQSAGAFIDSTKAFCDDLGKLTVAQQLVGRAMGLQADYLGQAKDAVPQPSSGPSAFTDKLIDHLPLQNIFKGPQYRAEEAERDAQRVMSDVYQANVVKDVDPSRPVLPTPTNPVNGPGGNDPKIGSGNGPDARNGGGTSSGGDGGPPSKSGTETGGGSGDQSKPGSDGTQTDSTTNGGNQDPGTNPSSATTPAGMASGDSAGGSTPGTPGGGLGNTTGGPSATGQGGTSGGGGVGFVPGRGFGGSAGGGGNSSEGGRTGGPGRSIPGAPGSGGAAAARAGGMRPGQAGTAGAPGMGAPGGRGKEEDEREVGTKDYLVYDRASELLGELPPALPPGGVIGA
ncbi:hypothetical protein [Nocardia sp. NPDC051570]|uniref:hypothetical protein n=1 Tax=Nocardia sp. NPDC051570 TaxID=3364324 RepID=UPI00378A7EC2